MKDGILNIPSIKSIHCKEREYKIILQKNLCSHLEVLLFYFKS